MPRDQRRCAEKQKEVRQRSNRLGARSARSALRVTSRCAVRRDAVSCAVPPKHCIISLSAVAGGGSSHALSVHHFEPKLRLALESSSVAIVGSVIDRRARCSPGAGPNEALRCSVEVQGSSMFPVMRVMQNDSGPYHPVA